MSTSNLVKILSCVFVVIVATCSPVSAVTITENFEGFSDGQSISPPWFNATGLELSNGTMTARDLYAGQGASAPSGIMAINQGDGESGGSLPTGSNLTDTDVVAELSLLNLGLPRGGHGLFGITNVADSDGNRYRSTEGNFMVLYTPYYGIEFYVPGGSGGGAAQGLYAQEGACDPCTVPGDTIRFRLATATASGAQTGTVSVSLNGGAFSEIRTVNLPESYAANYIAMGFRTSTYGDDLYYQSLPEPTSATLLGIGLVMMLMNRRRRSR